MIKNVAFVVGVLLTGVAMADIHEDLAQAVKKLRDADNYAWRMTRDAAGSQARPISMEGKSDKTGLSMLAMGSRQQVEMIIKGDKGVIRTDQGWQTADELSQEPSNRANQVRAAIQNFQPPLAMADQLVSRARNLKQADSSIEGDFSENDAKALLALWRDRSNPLEIANARATVKFWLKEGALVKFQTHLTGRVTTPNQERDLDYNFTVEIKDVGATKLDVPEEARKKLE